MKKLTHLAGSLTIMIALLAFSSGSAFADIVIKNGSTMKVTAGSNVVVSSDVTIETGGTVSNSGTVEVAGDFTNNGTADLGDGSVVFNGTALQTIGGTTVSEFEDLELDNSAGLDLGVGAEVDGTLTLTDGVLDIDAYSLTFGASAAAVGGLFDATTMILADDASCQVRKEFTDGTWDPGTFFFPIGSNDGTAEYSPLQLDFNNSTFASAYVGVNVTPLKEPNNTSLTNYLERYWTIENVNISSYTYDMTATYVTADIPGGATEADISGGLYHGTGWYVLDPVIAGSNTFFGDDVDDEGNATGVEFRILAGLGVVVQGAYNSGTDEMTTVLNPNIPLTAAAAYAHIGYQGTEFVGSIPSANIVDWILVEVRDATSAATATVAGDTVAGFLMNDGSIVGLDGVSPLPFRTIITNNAYFVIIHRNHLAVMTASAPSETFGNYTFDFSSAMANAYGTNAMFQADTSPVVYALFAGETNLSGVITYADKQPIDDDLNVGGYQLGDTNFSGVVTYADKQFVDDNINEAQQVPE